MPFLDISALMAIERLPGCELEITIDGVTQIAWPGLVVIVPANARHSIKALTDDRAIIVNYPTRHD